MTHSLVHDLHSVQHHQVAPIFILILMCICHIIIPLSYSPLHLSQKEADTKKNIFAIYLGLQLEELHSYEMKKGGLLLLPILSRTWHLPYPAPTSSADTSYSHAATYWILLTHTSLYDPWAEPTDCITLLTQTLLYHCSKLIWIVVCPAQYCLYPSLGLWPAWMRGSAGGTVAGIQP